MHDSRGERNPNEWSDFDNEAYRLLATWVARHYSHNSEQNPDSFNRSDLSERLESYLNRQILPPDDIYWEFAHFVAQAKGAIAPNSDYQDFHHEGPSQDAKSALENVRKYMSKYVELTIPTHFLGEFAPLSISQMNRMKGLRIFFVGLIVEKLAEFDGGENNASIFAFHDYAHAIRQIVQYEMVYKMLREKGLSGASIVRAFEDTQQGYRNFMANLEKENPRLARGVEGIFFQITNERSIPLEPSLFIKDLNQIKSEVDQAIAAGLDFEGTHVKSIGGFAGEKLSKHDFDQIVQLLGEFFKTQIFRFQTH